MWTDILSYLQATPSRNPEKTEQFARIVGGLSSPVKCPPSIKRDQTSPRGIEMKAVKAETGVAFKTPTHLTARRGMDTKLIKSEPKRAPVRAKVSGLFASPKTERKPRLEHKLFLSDSDSGPDRFSLETLRVFEAQSTKQTTHRDDEPSLIKKERPSEEPTPNVVKREETPFNARNDDARSIIDLTSPSPAHKSVREQSFIDLTRSSPFIKLESHTPVLRPLAYRSHSVIDISSDSDAAGDDESSDTLDSDDPGKYWIQRPKSFPLRPDTGFIRSALPPIGEEQTPKPSRNDMNDARDRLRSSPTPKRGRTTKGNPQVIKREDSPTVKREASHAPDTEHGQEQHIHRAEAESAEPRVFVPPPRPPARLDGPAHSVEVCAALFPSLQAAREALYAQEEKRGFQWRTQKTDLDGNHQ